EIQHPMVNGRNDQVDMTFGCGHVKWAACVEFAQVAAVFLKSQEHLLDVGGGDIAVQIGIKAGKVGHVAGGVLDGDVCVAINSAGLEIRGEIESEFTIGSCLEG